MEHACDLRTRFAAPRANEGKDTRHPPARSSIALDDTLTCRAFSGDGFLKHLQLCAYCA
jgi:hypothetical protein